MANALMATGLQMPKIDTMGAFAQGVNARQTTENNQLTLARKSMENIGSIALGAMDGNIDGEVNPERYEQGLDLLAENGMNVEAFRGRPEIAPIAARASMTALQQLQTAQNQQQIDLAIQKFQQELAKSSQPQPLPYEIIDGQVVEIDQAGGGTRVLGDHSRPEPGFRLLTPEEAAQMGLPPGKAFQVGPDNKVSEIGGSGVTVNNNMGQQNDDLFAALSEAEAGVYSGFIEREPIAARTLAQLDQLEELLENSPSGFGAVATQVAGNFGFDLGGASGVQAAQALINQMVPAQRPPGSGPMSDADLELFKQSVPRLINQPGGNELIIETMRNINLYDMELARIVKEASMEARAATTPAEKERIRQDMSTRINSLQNPMDNFRARISGSTEGGTVGGAPNPADMSDEELLEMLVN